MDGKINSRRLSDIIPPDGFQRSEYDSTSFSYWLQHLPLKPLNSKVHLYDGTLKSNQSKHFAVINIDIGNKDLQQCADAVIRLRAEYLYSHNKYDSISFNFTSGDSARFKDWVEGYRPAVSGNDVQWLKLYNSDSSYKNFQKYLKILFTYCGSYSLSRELKSAMSMNSLTPGDVFIQGGFPGHAVIVVDKAYSADTKETAFLLAQSYMPAQEIHIIRNLNNPSKDPWYILKEGSRLKTPDWIFNWSDQKIF